MCLRGTRSRQGRRANVQENDLEIDRDLLDLPEHFCRLFVIMPLCLDM